MINAEIYNQITEEVKCGQNLRTIYDSNYYVLKKLRYQAREIEKKWQSGVSEDTSYDIWQKVYTLSKEILINESKDLEISAWLIEASARVHGFQGLAESFNINKNLITTFWGELHPLIEDVDEPLFALAGLNGDLKPGTLIGAIYNIPITQATNQSNYCTWNYIGASKKKQKETSAQDSASLARFKNAVMATSSEFYANLSQNIENAINNYKELVQTITEICGNDAPPSSQILNALEECNDSLKIYAASKLAVKSESDANMVAASKNKIYSSRDVELNKLIEAANYFQQHEPHSPIPYILSRAVRWANTSYPELLQEMVKDQNTLEQVFRLTGIEANTNKN